MKLRKNIQRVLVVIFFISFIALAVTFDTEWGKENLGFFLSNMMTMISTGTLLILFGRWE